MYSLRLTCAAEAAEALAADLWEAGTNCIFETDHHQTILLMAGFESNRDRAELLYRFSNYSPEWRHEPQRDWIAETQAAWPARPVGKQLFLAPTWSTELTPSGRQRIVHNPGLACGTGEHPCTQLALMALERCVTNGCTVVDVGTGSGILSIAASRLGAKVTVGIDPDGEALRAATQNFSLNELHPQLAVGFADCVAAGCADVTVANISGTVLLSILDDLLRLTRPGGWLILTGFLSAEATLFEINLPGADISTLDDWHCLAVRPF